jgi:microcystin-dependent protein
MEKVGAYTERVTEGGEWRPGNPATGQQATPMLADYFNMLQRELVALVQAGGLTLDAENDAQVLASVQALITTGQAGKQPLHANLTAFSGLLGAADRLPYFTGVGALSLAVLTAKARAFLAATTEAAQRTALQLGTAAVANLQANPTDTALGALLFNGSWGVGATVAPPVNDANALTYSGLYRVGDTWVGSPDAGTTGTNQGYLQHYAWATTAYGLQTFKSVNSELVSKWRRKDNGVWSAWVENWHSGNLSLSALSPPGAVVHFARNTAPSGWLKANGAAISRTAYAALFAAIGTTFGAGDGGTTFNLPDLRGEFVRGWDDARGVDGGRGFGSAQADELKSHTHPIGITTSTSSGGGGNYYSGPNSTATSGATGGAETRPRNIALLACIKY